MPTVAIIFGMAIIFYYDDHDPPHFHVRAPGFRAKFDLEELTVVEVEGHMRPRDSFAFVPGATASTGAAGKTGRGPGERKPC
jgi:Domain of unknown function (DUF4160)